MKTSHTEAFWCQTYWNALSPPGSLPITPGWDSNYGIRLYFRELRSIRNAFQAYTSSNSTLFISVNVRLLLRNNAKAGYLGDCLLGAQNRLQRQQRWKSVSVLWTTRIGDCYSWTESDQVTIPIRAEIGWIGNRRNEDARGWKFGRGDLSETFGIWTHPRALMTRASYL